MSEQDPISQIAAPDGTEPVANTPAPAGGPPPAGGGVSGQTKISSLEDLREKAPEVYQKMLEGIAQKIVNEIKEHQDRLKKMMEEARRASGQS